MAVTKVLEKLPPVAWYALALPLVGSLGVLDWLSGTEFHFFLFYLLPVTLYAWYVGRTAGLVMSVLCLATLFLADVGAGRRYTGWGVPTWNLGIRLATFALFALLLSRLRGALERERDQARYDPLTALFNRRGFYGAGERVRALAERTGDRISVGYIDLDGFKQVNDRWGHAAGDAVLAAIGGVLARSVRASDVVGRLGGDEFALLLPATDAPAAKLLMERLRVALRQEMDANSWPVTFSVGVITFPTPLPLLREMLHRADDLMYRAKQAGKDQVVQEIVESASAPVAEASDVGQGRLRSRPGVPEARPMPHPSRSITR